jgi:ferredoxin
MWTYRTSGKLHHAATNGTASRPKTSFTHVPRPTNEDMHIDPDGWAERGPAWQLPLRWATIDGWYFRFSCTGGACATCRAKLVSGTVHMEQNYTLSEKDVAVCSGLRTRSSRRTRKSARLPPGADISCLPRASPSNPEPNLLPGQWPRKMGLVRATMAFGSVVFGPPAGRRTSARTQRV